MSPEQREAFRRANEGLYRKIQEWLAESNEDDCEETKKPDETETSEGQTDIPTTPPEGLVENPNIPESWGEYDENGKFEEKWRYDKGRPEIKKGHGSQDHIHINGEKNGTQ